MDEELFASLCRAAHKQRGETMTEITFTYEGMTGEEVEERIKCLKIEIDQLENKREVLDAEIDKIGSTVERLEGLEVDDD